MFGFSVNIFFASGTFFSLMARRSLIARICQRKKKEKYATLGICSFKTVVTEILEYEFEAM